MRHVSSIKKIIDEGKREEALNAIDNLLELGPSNMEALKLKAMIFASEGRHAEETLVWYRILQIDREDEDGIAFLLKQQNEDREHFYFTDPIPTGGRRYLAYPKQLFYASLTGLLGCLSFFAISRHLMSIETTNAALLHLTAFAVLVLSPALYITYGWIRSLRAVVVYPGGLIAETRFRKYQFQWKDLSDIALAYSGDPYSPRLDLVLRPNQADLPELMIDMSDDSSALRARSYLLKEIAAYIGPLRSVPMESLPNFERKTKKY